MLQRNKLGKAKKKRKPLNKLFEIQDASFCLKKKIVNNNHAFFAVLSNV